MNIRKLSVSAIAVAAMMATAGGAFAASTYTTAPSSAPAASTTTTAPAKPAAASTKVIFTMGKAGDQLSAAELSSALTAYDPSMLKAFDGAKSVKVFNINKAYTGADKTTVHALLTSDKATIAELRKAIDKDPTALKMLRENKIRAGQVVDIVDHNGQVSLYIS